MVTVGIILSFLSVSWLLLALYCHFLVFHGYGWHYCHILVFHGYGWHYCHFLVFDGTDGHHTFISRCLMVTVGIILSFVGV